MNGEESIRVIVFARQKLAQLKFLQLMNEPIVFGCDFTLRLQMMRFVLFLGRELLQSLEIADLAFQFAKRIDKRTQA